MSTSTVIAFILLLLPVPLALLMRPAPAASPDPREVRRRRFAVIGFALAIAVMELAYLGFTHQLGTPLKAAPGPLPWAFMSWFFLAILFVELRLPRREPFPGQSRRSASLKPRGLEPPVGLGTWGTLAAIWTVLLISALTLAPDPWVAVPFLLQAGVLMAFGPRLVKQAAWGAEPQPPKPSARLEAAYAKRRRGRPWVVFSLVALTFISYTALAAYSEHLQAGLRLFFMVMGAWFLTYGILEVRWYLEIRRLRAQLSSDHEV